MSINWKNKLGPKNPSSKGLDVATCSTSLTLRSPSELPERDGEILVALWGASEWEIVSVRENVGGPFTAEYKGSGDPAYPEEWQWWADLRNLVLPN